MLRLSHRGALLALGFLGRPILDAIILSMIVLCILGYVSRTSVKFWRTEYSGTLDLLSEEAPHPKLVIDWPYFGKGLFYIGWMLFIAFACYFVGAYILKF